MKQLSFFGIILLVSINTMAQGNSHKKGKDKNKHATEINDSENENEDYQKNRGNGNSPNARYSNHQPKKVTAAFLNDYPGARNVSWSKYKGDYTATFTNGIWKSTAVYHANGERRDTRTNLTKAQLPGRIWDQIFKRDHITPTKYIQIERPSTDEKIFRILTANNTAYYYNQNGKRVKYNY
ncbi:MAG: hypothetical protein ABIP35_04860 [Ginsengibacter sp.]